MPPERDDWKYVPLRRILLFLERTLDGAMQWVGFEPNDEPLWVRFRAFFRRIRRRRSGADVRRVL